MLQQSYSSFASDEVASLLKAADKYRISSEKMQLETQITTLNEDGSVAKERRYMVFNQPNRQSLVVMKSAAEAGQKILMLGDDFWLVLAGSQRPLRITPMQKILGDASVGDVATLSWAQDYSGEIVGQERCDEKACLHLSLNSSRKGSAYQHIDLWLGVKHHEPLKADLYVLSGKLAKQAKFIMDHPEKPVTMTEMVLQDNMSKKQLTRMRYLSRKDRDIPEQWLNPMFWPKILRWNNHEP